MTEPHDYLKAAKEASHVPHMGSFYALVAIAEELRRINDGPPDTPKPSYIFNVGSVDEAYEAALRRAVGE